MSLSWKCFSSAWILWFNLALVCVFRSLVQYGATGVLPEADLWGLPGLVSLSGFNHDVSQVPSLTATLVVPEVLRPNHYMDVILFSLPFFDHIRTIGYKTVKGYDMRG